MAPPSYTLRVSVKLRGEKPILGLEELRTIALGQATVSVRFRNPYLILRAGEFISEREAEEFLPSIKRGLLHVAIKYNLAFRYQFERREITRAKDPVAAALNVSKTFSIDEPMEPLHGLTDEEGYVVLRNDENIRVITMGTPTLTVSTPWEAFSQALAEGAQTVAPPPDRMDAKLSTAIDLFLSNFYESSARARLLTLVTCLEVLAPTLERDPVVVKAIADFKETIAAHAKEANRDQREALADLENEISFKKETSIRRRVRALVMSEAPLPDSIRAEFAKEVVASYDVRSALVHNGLIAAPDLHTALDTALRAVKLLLSARLGLQT